MKLSTRGPPLSVIVEHHPAPKSRPSRSRLWPKTSLVNLDKSSADSVIWDHHLSLPLAVTLGSRAMPSPKVIANRLTDPLSAACLPRSPKTVSLAQAINDQAVDPDSNLETGEMSLKVPLPISLLLKLNSNRLLNSELPLEVVIRRWLLSLSQT